MSNWQRFTHSPVQNTEPTPANTPSFTPKSQPNTAKTPLPETINSVPRTKNQLTFPEHKPIINPPLAPNFDQQKPEFLKRRKPQVDTPPTPRQPPVPEPSVSATQQPELDPTPTPIEEPTPTFSPSPSVENPPTEEPTPTPTFSPILTPDVAPTTSSVEAVPSPAVTVTPLENPANSN